MRGIVGVAALVAFASCSRSRALPKKWKVSASFGAGLCAETATDACNTSWEVAETGPIHVTDHFRAGPKTRDIVLTADDRNALERALRSARFWDGMDSDNPCPGEVHDLWIHLSFENVDSGSSKSHNITPCEDDHFAKDVTRLLMRR